MQRRINDERRATVGGCSEYIELIALRGSILGSIDDYETAETIAERLVCDAPSDGHAFLARARARSRFHRFPEALDDLDAARGLGINDAVEVERASIFQSVGRYDDAFALLTDMAARRPDFEALADLATLHAERQEVVAAEGMFDASRACYRRVSPFPLAILDFQRGHMWMTKGDLQRAAMWFQMAIAKLPCYATACGHLAEVEAALGNYDAAIARLLPLSSSDDPVYAASLGRVLGKAGRAEESAEYRRRAAARYDELMTRHPQAFADHAAEFWLDEPSDRQRALHFATMNLEIRQTPRARQLFARASAP